MRLDRCEKRFDQLLVFDLIAGENVVRAASGKDLEPFWFPRCAVQHFGVFAPDQFVETCV